MIKTETVFFVLLVTGLLVAGGPAYAENTNYGCKWGPKTYDPKSVTDPADPAAAHAAPMRLADAKAKTENGDKGDKEDAAEKGLELVKEKGCVTCHTVDGVSLLGPSLKGMYGKKSVVVTDGVEREAVVDEEYLRRAIKDPKADLLQGFPPIMPSSEGLLTDEEVGAIVEYIKSLTDDEEKGKD